MIRTALKSLTNIFLKGRLGPLARRDAAAGVSRQFGRGTGDGPHRLGVLKDRLAGKSLASHRGLPVLGLYAGLSLLGGDPWMRQ
jgi:hypothetical protein